MSTRMFPLYELIIIDFSMPETRGYEVAKEVRKSVAKLLEDIKKLGPQFQNLGLRQPYLVCLSAYDDKFFRQIAIEAGMHEYILKPIGI